MFFIVVTLRVSFTLVERLKGR